MQFHANTKYYLVSLSEIVRSYKIIYLLILSLLLEKHTNQKKSYKLFTDPTRKKCIMTFEVKKHMNVERNGAK